MKHFITQLRGELKNHLIDYLLLITAGVFFLLFLHLFAGNRTYTFLSLLAFVSFYIIWAIYHHIRNDDLHLKTVVEYILIGFTVVFFLKIIFLP